MLNALPLPHVYGNIVMNGTFMAGATLVMMERFDAATALAEIQRHHATVFDGVPTMYAMMLADPSLPGADLSSLRICAVGGQTMPAAKMAEWERRSQAPLLELWGMTELGGPAPATAATCPTSTARSASHCPGGGPHRRTRRSGAHTPRRRAGELMVRGPLVMLGYYGNKQATQAAIEPGGWLHTGDIATRDDEGRYFIVDRKKDLIITGGFNVYPAEIERVVASHPAVAMVAVGSCPMRSTANWPAPTWCSAPAPRPPRLKSSTTAGRTWPPTSGPAPSGSCPTCPRHPPARSCAGN